MTSKLFVIFFSSLHAILLTCWQPKNSFANNFFFASFYSLPSMRSLNYQMNMEIHGRKNFQNVGCRAKWIWWILRLFAIRFAKEKFRNGERKQNTKNYNARQTTKNIFNKYEKANATTNVNANVNVCRRIDHHSYV